MEKSKTITQTYNMRANFAKLLHKEMEKNDKIIVIAIDLGYVMWDQIQKDFPDRFVNCGAAEQLALGIAVGMALEGKIPIVYSISSFVLLRPAEFIRNYLGHDGINVKLVGSGLEDDYSNQGYTHHFFKTEEYCEWMDIDYLLPNKDSFEQDFKNFMIAQEPVFIGLRK